MDTPPPIPDAEILAEETVHGGRFPKQVVRFRYRRFDGTLSRALAWEIFRRGPAVALLPYDPRRDRVVLIEQFRLPARYAGVPPWLLEVPAGLLDSEDPAHCARREVHEETGLAVGRMEALGHYLLTPGGSDETVHIFAGEVAAPAADAAGIAGYFGLADENEDIRVRVFDAADAVAAAFDGRVRNAITVIALAWLGLNRDRLRRAWAGE
jgi:ADP-ribose pyrophosphatase